MKFPNRDEMKAAQFLMKELYVDWIWQERIKASPPVPKSRIKIPFKWRKNVIPFRRSGS